MTIEKKNIKTYSNYLVIFIIGNLFIFLYISFGYTYLINFLTSYFITLIESSILFSILSIFTFIFNGLITSDFKAILVFWRIKNIYPGCRIFTKLTEDNYRINKLNLIELYGNLPVEPVAQNKLWYKIYLKNQFDHRVFDSHRNFLISRDLTGLSYLLLLLYSINSLIIILAYNLTPNALLYQYFLIIQFILVSKVSNNYGNRFADNVLAIESNNS